MKNYDLRSPLLVRLIAEFLLEAGASVLSKDRGNGREKMNNGESTPLDEARISGNKKLIKLLEVAIAS
ncbi:unnamed protein product [Prunus armeniaca]